MKKILATFLILSTFLSCVFAKQVCKIAYIGNSTMPSANVAIYNGVRDALNGLQSRDGKKFEIDFISENSSENQTKKIFLYHLLCTTMKKSIILLTIENKDSLYWINLLLTKQKIRPIQRVLFYITITTNAVPAVITRFTTKISMVLNLNL